MHVSCLFLFIECPIGYFGRNCADKCPPPLFGRLCGQECPHNCKSCHYIFGCTIIKETQGKVSQINLFIFFSFSYVSIEAYISCLLYFNFFFKAKQILFTHFWWQTLHDSSWLNKHALFLSWIYFKYCLFFYLNSETTSKIIEHLTSELPVSHAVNNTTNIKIISKNLFSI